jgi:tRNA (cmo5U34)-methyltransferase
MKDNYMPAGRWTFTAEVADCFSDMLRRSIPNYGVMRELVFAMGRNFVQPDTTILDIGCSTGEGINPFIDYFGEHNKYALVDNSIPMIEKCRQKYSDFIERGIVSVFNIDASQELPDCNTSLIMAVLSIQFMPQESRVKVIQRIYDSLNPGGAFILVEKVIGDNALIDELLIREYYKLKKKNGYSDDAISSKRKSLEFSLLPVKDKYNVDMLKESGFRAIECFWRTLNFSGILAVK